MAENKRKFKEKLAYCGTRFLTGVTAATVGLAAAAPFANLPSDQLGATVAGVLAAATLFGAAAKYVGRKEEKPKWLDRVQNFTLGIAFCGAAALKSLDPFVVEQDRLQLVKSDGGAMTMPPAREDGKTIKFSDWVKVMDNSKASPEDIANIVDGVATAKAANFINARNHKLENANPPLPVNDDYRRKKQAGERA